MASQKRARPDPNSLERTWLGLGCPIAERADPDMGLSNERCTGLLDALDARERNALLPMLYSTGAVVGEAARIGAARARVRLRALGIVLPPWWRLRLAVRATGWTPKD